MNWLPMLRWARVYDRRTCADDLLAAVIVVVMLIPQSLAYALLAGLPPEAGLYASVVPLILYGLFGTSGALAVGPVAVVSLMTAQSVGDLVAVGTPEYAAAAMMLAVLSGVILLGMGVMKLGFVANFLSHPVISGFITASGLLIAAGQLRHVLGVDGGGGTLPEMLTTLFLSLSHIHVQTALIGFGVIAFLYGARKGLAPMLEGIGVPRAVADAAKKTAPILTVIGTIVLVRALDLEAAGVRVVGDIPVGLPPLAVPQVSMDVIAALAVPALLISVVGFVESVSVAQTLAAKRRERVEPDRELIALGAANIGAGVSGGYPVTGGFARSVVNFDAGARTPAAGIFTAIGIALAALTLTPYLYSLPKATLSATIIVAVLGLVDFKGLARTWRVSRSDFIAQFATIGLTLAAGVEVGIVAGVGLSVFLHLYRTSAPHWAEVGQVPGTEHFRNIRRHNVVTVPEVLSLRMDESLYFPNARFLEDCIAGRVSDRKDLRHVVLMCPAVNAIDASALESLEAINERLSEAGVTLHLSEVKGPVMDVLKRSDFFAHFTGQVFLTQFDALHALAPDCAEKTLAMARCETEKPVPD